MTDNTQPAHPLADYIPNTSQLKGLVTVFIASLLCIWLNNLLSELADGRLLGLSSLTLAILIGMIIGNTIYQNHSATLSAGVDFAKGQILRLAIVLYGFKITLTEIASVGSVAIVIDALVLSSTFMLTYWLGTKWLKIDKTTTLLIGSGASICGAAAVIATQPVLKADAHKVTIAVATVVVFGTVAMLLYPYLYSIGWLNSVLTEQQYGVYTGSTVHEVAQVVVAGNAISTDVGHTAVVTKMIRVMMLAPFLLLLSALFNQTNPSQSNLKNTNHSPSSQMLAKLKRIQIPWFAFVFIAMVGVNSWLLSLNHSGIAEVTHALVVLDDVLLTMAMFALGLTTHLSAIKQAGMKPLVLAGMVFVWLIFGGALINVLGSLIFGAV